MSALTLHAGGHAGRGPLLHLDETSALAHADAAATLGAIEAALHARGLSLGPIPVESRARTLGAALASPRPSEAGPGGRLIDRCASIDALLPDGARVSTRLAPRKATGPDYAQALLGARGATGRITAAWMRARRRPAMTSFAGFAIVDRAGAAEASSGGALAQARRLLRAGALPSELLLVDAPLGAEVLAGAAEVVAEMAPGTTLALLRFDGAREVVLAEERLAGELLGASGARALAPRLVEDLLVRRDPLRLLERFVPSEQLGAAWAARRAPSALLGLRHAGAAFCAPSAAALPAVAPPSPQVGALHAALQQALVPPVGDMPQGARRTWCPV